MRTKQTLALLALLAVLSPAPALANGYDVPNVGPRDLSLAGSAGAAQVDAGAVYANPAALARLPGLSLALGGSVLMLETKWNDVANTLSTKTKVKPVPPVALFGSYGFELFGQRAGIGAGVTVPGGGNVFYPDDWPGRGRIITVDRKIYAGLLNAGIELTEGIRVGGGVVYYYGTEYLKQGIQPFPDAFGELSTRGGGTSFQLALEIGPFGDVPLQVGVDFKYQGKMKLRGDGRFQVPPALQAAVQDQGVKHDLTYPSQLHVALAYRLVPSLQVLTDFSYAFYNVYTEDRFTGDKGVTILVPRGYGDGQTYRLGLEWDATRSFTLRVGGLRDISGQRLDLFSPSLPDGNVWAATGGIGLRLSSSLALNAGFFYAWFDEVKPTGTEVLLGTFKTNVWIASAGISWNKGQ
jgi:long-chain fatty acid transport protein